MIVISPKLLDSAAVPPVAPPWSRPGCAGSVLYRHERAVQGDRDRKLMCSPSTQLGRHEAWAPPSPPFRAASPQLPPPFARLLRAGAKGALRPAAGAAPGAQHARATHTAPTRRLLRRILIICTATSTQSGGRRLAWMCGIHRAAVCPTLPTMPASGACQPAMHKRIRPHLTPQSWCRPCAATLRRRLAACCRPWAARAAAAAAAAGARACGWCWAAPAPPPQDHLLHTQRQVSKITAAAGGSSNVDTGAAMVALDKLAQSGALWGAQRPTPPCRPESEMSSETPPASESSRSTISTSSPSSPSSSSGMACLGDGGRREGWGRGGAVAGRHDVAGQVEATCQSRHWAGQQVASAVLDQATTTHQAPPLPHSRPLTCTSP